jgi:hypothetical protein
MAIARVWAEEETCHSCFNRDNEEHHSLFYGVKLLFFSCLMPLGVMCNFICLRPDIDTACFPYRSNLFASLVAVAVQVRVPPLVGHLF